MPDLDPKRVWHWARAGRETMIEVLMPAQRDEGTRDLPALWGSTRALRHLDFLLGGPIHAVCLYRGGVLVQVPRPEAYAIHKLIFADRRCEGAVGTASRKDRAQAAFLIEALSENRPDELAEAYADALARGPRWRARLRTSLARMPDSRERLEALTLAAPRPNQCGNAAARHRAPAVPDRESRYKIGEIPAVRRRNHPSGGGFHVSTPCKTAYSRTCCVRR